MTQFFNLSYIIATYNRLPFLKISLEKLLHELQADEEIVVVDGNSTDGSKEYLTNLFEEGKIHQFISEPDKNQAHGWNKAMLMAKGSIIKKIIDDDVHDVNAVRECKEFMLKNPEIDVCITNCLQGYLTDPTKIEKTGREFYYQQWKKGMIKAFTFSDVSMLIRKSSLSLIGLYDTQFTMLDWEYALRISYLQSKIAYYTGYNSLSVSTPGNVTSEASKKILKYEQSIGKIKYDYAGDAADIGLYSQIKIGLGKTYSKLLKPSRPGILKLPDESQLKEIYAGFYQKLDEYNKTGSFNFLN